MDVGAHHLAQRVVYGPVPRQGRESVESAADDLDVEVSTPVLRTGVPGMAVAVIADIEPFRRKRRRQSVAYLFDPLRTHGRTGRNGRISTRS
jgi:hypothetical protein